MLVSVFGSWFRWKRLKCKGRVSSSCHAVLLASFLSLLGLSSLLSCRSRVCSEWVQEAWMKRWGAKGEISRPPFIYVILQKLLEN